MYMILFLRCSILYYVINRWSKRVGPKKMWDTLFKKKRRKTISHKKYLLIVKVVTHFFDRIIKRDKCVVQATILAYFLQSRNSVVLKLGCKNMNYYRFQKLSFNDSSNFSIPNQRDFHCWVTYNGEPVVQPFYETFWTTIYAYEI